MKLHGGLHGVPDNVGGPYRTPGGSGKYTGFRLRIETEAKRTTIIVDIFDII